MSVRIRRIISFFALIVLATAFAAEGVMSGAPTPFIAAFVFLIYAGIEGFLLANNE